MASGLRHSGMLVRHRGGVDFGVQSLVVAISDRGSSDSQSNSRTFAALP